MNKINIPQAAAVVCAPLWIYPGTRTQHGRFLNAGPSENVSVHIYMHMLIAIPTILLHHTVRCFVLAYLCTRYVLDPSHVNTMAKSLDGLLFHHRVLHAQPKNTKIPLHLHDRNILHMAHLTYVSTRYGLGPSHFRTVATSLASLPGYFMHSKKTPSYQYTYMYMTETSHMAHLTCEHKVWAWPLPL